MLNTRSEKPARGEETRQRILAASLALVSTRGVEGLSIRAVAKRARVSVGLAHYHFGDRRALVRAALEASREAFLAKATAEPPTGDGAIPLRKTLQLVRALVDFMPGWYRVVPAGRHGPQGPRLPRQATATAPRARPTSSRISRSRAAARSCRGSGRSRRCSSRRLSSR
jgi:AcrR family transcriptional regulator